MLNEAAVASALLSPAVVIWALKHFLNRHQKQGAELEKSKRDAIKKEIGDLSGMCKNLSQDMKMLRDTISGLDKQIAILADRFDRDHKNQEKMMVAFQGFVETSSKRVTALETQVSTVTEIAKDVFRVSSKKG